MDYLCFGLQQAGQIYPWRITLLIVFGAALIPIIALIIIGYGLKRTAFLADAVWSGIEQLTYFVLFPALLIRTLAKQTLAGSPWPSMLLVITGTLMASATILILWHRMRASSTGATFTSIFQGGVRFNTYIALAVAQALYGSKGLTLASVAAGLMIVFINLLCISVFALWGKTEIKGAKYFIREIVANPLIIACAVGCSLSLSGVRLPSVVADILEMTGRAALPLGLLAVGAALRPEFIRGHVEPISVSSLAQFIVKPLMVVSLINYTGLTGVAAGVLVIAFMTPTSPSGYILARQLGGDTETMVSIISFQTLLAFLLMPILALLLPTISV